MTILEAIDKVNALIPNTYTDEEKVAWLSVLDGLIKRDIIDTHMGWKNVVFEGYPFDVDMSTVLLVPEPYSDMYIFWLESKIYYANNEYTKYNNAVSRYNDMFKTYANNYNRTHMPLGVRSVKYF